MSGCEELVTRIFCGLTSCCHVDSGHINCASVKIIKLLVLLL